MAYRNKKGEFVIDLTCETDKKSPILRLIEGAVSAGCTVIVIQGVKNKQTLLPMLALGSALISASLAAQDRKKCIDINVGGISFNVEL